jgi:type VI secretion system protein ImpJ
LGVDHCEIDDDALGRGRFILRSATGVFPDGVAFHHPEGSAGRLELDLPADVNDATIKLVRDDTGTVPGRLELRLEGDGTDPSAMPLARMQRRSDGSLTIDRNFLPPTRVVHASPKLSGLLQDVTRMVEQRATLLAARLGSLHNVGIAGVADFMMLKDLNQAHVELSHLAALRGVHPERLYLSLARLVARLRTYSDSRLGLDLPTYRHVDSGEPFFALAAELRQHLSMVLEASARQLPIVARSYGVHSVSFDDAVKKEKGSFVLEVRAAVPPEALRARFPAQVKIGPIDRIRDLVNLQLPGIALKPMAVSPRQLPYHAGSAYFELGTAGSDLWRGALASDGMALHVAGDFPELELALWVVPDRT